MVRPLAKPSAPCLSRRETDVLLLVARSKIDKEIAADLGITLGTVRVYRKRLNAKLGTKGAVEPILVAWRLGILDLERIAEETIERCSRRREDAVRGSARPFRDKEVATDAQLTS